MVQDSRQLATEVPWSSFESIDPATAAEGGRRAAIEDGLVHLVRSELGLAAAKGLSAEHEIGRTNDHSGECSGSAHVRGGGCKDSLMGRRLVFDIYGRFVIHAEQSDHGDWLFYRPGTDGKRGRISDVAVDRDATLEEIETQLEAIYHELGRLGTSITQIDGPARS